MFAKRKPWFKFWPAAVPENLDYPEVPLHQLLRKSAKKHPEALVLVFFEREITYAELDLLSDQFAAAPAALGVKKDGKVAVFLPNIPQFINAYFGALKAGPVITAISPMRKEREVAYQLNDSQAETIVSLDTIYPIIKKVWRKTKLKNAVVTKMEEYGSKNPVIRKTHKSQTFTPSKN